MLCFSAVFQEETGVLFELMNCDFASSYVIAVDALRSILEDSVQVWGETLRQGARHCVVKDRVKKGMSGFNSMK